MKLISRFYFFFYILLFFAFTMTVSCKSKVYCLEPELQLHFEGFDTLEMKAIEILEYEPGTKLNQLKRTIYFVKSVYTNTTDSVSTFEVKPNTYYQFKILHSGQIYTLHDIQSNKSFYKKDNWIGEADVCINDYVYSVDNNQNHVPMKIQESSLENDLVVIRKRLR